MTGISEEAIDFVLENRRGDVCECCRRVPLRGFRSTRPATDIGDQIREAHIWEQGRPD